MGIPSLAIAPHLMFFKSMASCTVAQAPGASLRAGRRSQPAALLLARPVTAGIKLDLQCRNGAPCRRTLLATAADGGRRCRGRHAAAAAPGGDTGGCDAPSTRAREVDGEAEQFVREGNGVHEQAHQQHATTAADEQQQQQDEQRERHEQQTAAPAATTFEQQQQEQQQQGGAAAAAAAEGHGTQHTHWAWLRQQLRWQLPAVPWALNTTITLLVLWLVCFWLAAYSLVPAVLLRMGVDPSGSTTQALRHLVLDGLQVAATALLLWRGLSSYRPRALGLFAAPLRPLRAWLPAVVVGAASFPCVDLVYKRMVAMLALEEAVVASGPADQILGTSSWATQALWFAVLAVCAPVWEELMFRGFLLPSLARYLPRWGALAVTSLIFALVHFSREGLLPLLLLGCVFGGAYASTRNLLAPIALHSLWNVCLLVQLLLAGGGA